jgi:hypothetical protein
MSGDDRTDRDDRADRGDDDEPSVQNPFTFSDEPGDGHDTDGDAAAATDDGTLDADTETGTGSGGSRRDAPLGDLARRVGERSRGRDHDSRGRSDPFEEVDVDDVGTQELWSQLEAERPVASDAGIPTGDPDDADPVVGVAEPDADPSDPGDTRPEHVLDKREYCQRCPHLSAPPNVACDNDGTDIVEVVDGEHFRVRGCPMITTEGKPNFAAAEEADGGAPDRDAAAVGGTAPNGASHAGGDPPDDA